ncbi:MAG: NAD-dependent epimerase/dehydratase family protein [Novosphingobium sp.]|nr:NAD-dependent epimerase/dehydratase family protein [Novosphingobium sp.]
MSGHRHMLIAGASGVIGSAAVELFARMPDWEVTALSRRRPVVAQDTHFDHASADLRDADDCARAVAALGPVTHCIYAAVSEAPGLVSGWHDASLIAQNGQMFANLLTPLAGSGALQHVSLMQGTKAYGVHVRPVDMAPLREDTPRDDHANFYWLHEDCARELGAQHKFAFTVFRPQVLLGTAPGAVMNPVAGIGAYAALCRELGLVFALPGDSEALWEMVDAGLLAEAMAWAADASDAANETYNLTNGDVFVLRHAWPQIGDALGLDTQGTPPETFAAFFAQPDVQAAWTALALREGLALENLDDLLGQSQHYLDLLLGTQIATKQTPALLSTIKIREAGFAACRDSRDSLIHQLRQMMELGLLPRMGMQK